MGTMTFGKPDTTANITVGAVAGVGKDDRVVINGHDITPSIKKIRMSAAVGELTRIELGLSAAKSTVVDGKAHVYLSAEDRKALVALGWTPPVDADAMTGKVSGSQGAPETHAWEEFRTLGLLWLINTSVLHPRGFALAFVYDDDRNPIGWQLVGDGSEPWTFLDECDDRFQAVEALFDQHRKTSLPAGWTGVTADVYEHESPKEAVYIDENGIMPGGCGNSRPGTSICTRPAGHPRTLHIAHDTSGKHVGEWDDTE